MNLGSSREPAWMYTKPSIAAQVAPVLSGQVLGQQSLRVHTMPMVHKVLEDIGFAQVVTQLYPSGVDVPIHKILEVVIQSRLQSPKPVPVSHLQEWVSKTVLPQILALETEKVNDSRIGRTLELVAETAPVMWNELVRRATRAYALDLELIVYDTSSWHFEGEYAESDIVKYGYSRDGKTDCKQVNLGINAALDKCGIGIPVLYEVIPGNINDSSTVAANLARLQFLHRQLGNNESRLQVCGDRALLNIAKLHLYRSAQVDVIGSMSACSFNDKAMASVSEQSLLGHPLQYVAHRHQQLPADRLDAERYYAVRTTVSVPSSEDVPGSEAFDMAALVVLGSGKRRLDEKHRETLLEKTEARLAEIATHLNKGRYQKTSYTEAQRKAAIGKYPAIKGMVSYELTGQGALDNSGSDSKAAQSQQLSLKWNRVSSKIDEAKRLDGRYVVYFARESMSNDEVFAQFKARDCVEKCVDQVKGPGPVVVRPVFLHKDQRIRGLILACMVGALVTGLIERQVRTTHGYRATGKGIQDLFSDFEASLQTFSDYSQIIVMPRTSKWQDNVLDSVGVTLPATTIVTVEEWRYCTPVQPPPEWMLPVDKPKSEPSG
jgi:transposase